MISVILAGGLGTRISNETQTKPKPMIKIINKPIIKYIIDYYRLNNVNKFIIAGGYKFLHIKKYFLSLKDKNLFFDDSTNLQINKNKFEEFKLSNLKKKYFIKICNTGLKTETGGRIFKLKKILMSFEYFFVTYGDGICNARLNKTRKIFINSSADGIVTAVKSPPRFGEIIFDKKNLKVKKFSEKPSKNSTWINGGYFIFKNNLFNYLKKNENFESVTLPKLVSKKKLIYFKHKGYWQCMDTPRDKIKITEDIKFEKIKF